MANGSTADKARKARNKADDAKYGYGDAERIANKIAKTATGKDLTMTEEERAAKIIYGRRVRDTGRTAARANFIERRTEKKASSDRIKAAVGGGAAPKKQAPKPVAKKAPAKPTSSFGGKTRDNMSKPTGKKPVAKPATKTTPMPKTTTKAPAKAKMTPQDAAMKKLLEKKYGKIYG